MNVEIVTMNVNKLEHLQDLLTQIRQKNKQLKSDVKNCMNLTEIQTTTVWLQLTVRSSCWSSMFNWIWPEPTSKRLNYLIFTKIHSNTFGIDKTFSCSSQVTMKLKKKIKKKKIKVRFSIVDFPGKPANRKTKKTNSSYKIIEVTHFRRSGRGHRMGVLICKQKYFFKKFLIWPTGLPRRRSSPKIAAIWRNNLTAQ